MLLRGLVKPSIELNASALKLASIVTANRKFPARIGPETGSASVAAACVPALKS